MKDLFWTPKFTLTPAIAGGLMQIEAARALVDHTPLPPAAENELRVRMTRNLLKDWVEDGWLEVANPSRRARSYRLSAKYRQYIGSLSAMIPGGEKNEQ